MMADTFWANVLIALFAAVVIALNLWHAWWLDRKHHREER